jgi:hypothetical protein
MKYYLPLVDKIVDEETAKNYSFAVPIGIPKLTGPNTSIVNGIQQAWDNTSISLFKTCPRKYYYTIHLGYVAKVTPPPLAFGIYFHSLCQTWHHLLSAGVDKETSLLRIVRLAGLFGEALPAGDTSRTKETLVRTIVWYLEQFWDDAAKPVILSNGTPASEYSFTIPLMEYQNLEVYLCGHIDLMVKWQGKVYTMDYKTTKYGLDRRFFAKFKPSTQMPLYTAATHIIAGETQDLPSANGVIIDGIQLGVNFSRYARGVVEFSLEEVEEYLEGLKYWIKQAMDACAADYFPANEESCEKYGGCVFRDICSKPAARREAYLEGNFGKQTWDCLQSR